MNLNTGGMWLDRLSGQSTPATGTPPQSRSPAPRRYPSTGPNRPSVAPRSSSLANASLSSTSLPLSSRRSSAAHSPAPGARNLAHTVPPPDVPDPTKVLEQIIGAPPREQTSGAPNGQLETVEKPAILEEEIDFGGLSLQAFVETEKGSTRRKSVVHTQNNQSIEEFNKEKDKFEDLHKSIAACDDVLKSVETYLTGFRADLVTVSAEIETLQTRSQSLSTKLENRKVVEKLLGPSVEDISISPAVVRKISEGNIDEGWVAALSELEKRSKTIDAKSKQNDNIRAVTDVKPLLDDLKTKAIQRIRDYLVTQIKAMRAPSMNAQILQQTTMLRYKEIYGFLARHHHQLADEICQAYVNTMRWYYHNNFSRYHKAIEKLKIHIVDKTDSMASDNALQRGPSFATSAGAKVPGAPHDTFSLGRRLDILKHSNPSALSSYVVEEDKSTHYLETAFHTFNLALIDNASFEYTFLTSFFTPAHSYRALERTFNTIFEPTFQLGQTLTKTLTESTFDALGILLAVRINQHFAFQLQRRKVPAVDGYVNYTNMLLWPRFQQVMDSHCSSIKTAASSLAGRPSASSSLVGSGPTSAAQSTAPQPLTQRFANFLQGILTMSSEAGDDEPVSNSLQRLRGEFEGWLIKMSKSVSDQRKRQRFLYNNYSLICTILEGEEGRMAEEMMRHFSEERDRYAETG